MAVKKTRYALSVVRATGFVKGLWRAEKTEAPPSDADRLVVEVTKELYDGLHQKDMYFDGGAPRFKWINSAVVEQRDTRRRLRFTPSTVDVDVGDPTVEVTVEVLRPDGTPDSDVNGREVLTVDRNRIRLVFTLGVATILVRTNRSYSFELRNQKSFRIPGGFSVSVAATDVS